MPASQPHTDWRARWLPILFWIGVGMAPTAAVLLLVGQGGGPLRIAAVLAIFCVTLIGLSVALRNDVEQVRTEIESTVLDEADAIRDETREDIVAVARKLHAALRKEVADLEDQVAELRRQLSTPGARVPDLSDETSEFPRGVVRRTETYQVTRQTTMSSDDARRNEYATAGAASGRARATRPAPGHPTSSHPTTSRPAASHPAASRPAASRSGAGSTATSWSEPTRQYVDPGRAAAERRSWDPLNDDLADRPGATSPVSSSPMSSSPLSAGPPTDGGGRRRAAEPDAPVPIAEIEAARPVDPWADLRNDTQPATVRFGEAWSDEPTRDQPGPLDPGWRNSRW